MYDSKERKEQSDYLRELGFESNLILSRFEDMPFGTIRYANIPFISFTNKTIKINLPFQRCLKVKI